MARLDVQQILMSNRRRTERIQARDGSRCCWCGYLLCNRTEYTPDQQHRIATLEHVIPLSKGGKNSDGNYRVACHDCNTVRQTGWKPDEIVYYKKCPLIHFLKRIKHPVRKKFWLPTRSRPKTPILHLVNTWQHTLSTS